MALIRTFSPFHFFFLPPPRPWTSSLELSLSQNFLFWILCPSLAMPHSGAGLSVSCQECYPSFYSRKHACLILMHGPDDPKATSIFTYKHTQIHSRFNGEFTFLKKIPLYDPGISKSGKELGNYEHQGSLMRNIVHRRLFPLHVCYGRDISEHVRIKHNVKIS